MSEPAQIATLLKFPHQNQENLPQQNKSLQQQVTQSHSNPVSLNGKFERIAHGSAEQQHILTVWGMFASNYQELWTSRYGLKPDDLWCEYLLTVSTEMAKWAVYESFRHHPDYPPKLSQFMKIVSDGAMKSRNEPVVEKIMHMIINAAYAQGSIADRYKHPLAWAVAQHKDLDKYTLKAATTKQALAMITPIYAEILHSGYPQFSESDYEVRLAIEKKKTPQNELNTKKHLSSLRGALKVEVTKPDRFKATEDCKIHGAVLDEMRCEAVDMSKKFKVEVA